MKKVILISIDGMRPDALAQCGNPFVENLKKAGSYTLNARTMFPSVTLPCHMSMFHSVPPERHGILNNTYVPMVRPVTGLFEQLRHAGSVNAMFYGWEQMRNVAQPGDLTYAEFMHVYARDGVDGYLTDRALARIEESKPDFVFLYMPETDDKGGHDCGWMSETYLKLIHDAIANVQRVYEALKDEYTIIITADHGGHDRVHGTDLPEDMTIPMFFIGPDFEAGRELEGVTMLDITPTIAKVMGVAPDRAWEGRSVV